MPWPADRPIPSWATVMHSLRSPLLDLCTCSHHLKAHSTIGSRFCWQCGCSGYQSSGYESDKPKPPKPPGPPRPASQRASCPGVTH